MISFRCTQCGKDLKVKEELGGKRVRCPHCKRAHEIPRPFSEGATVPPSGARYPAEEEEGTLPSSWSPPPAAEPTQESHAEEKANASDEEAGEDLDATAHYKVAGEIARGGMGAIKRAVDQDICREIAVKFLLNHADDQQKARFVEEAQITGQLEHPNIVPIHQLGVHEDGRCFFSMKMVKGRSLADILKRQGEPGASAAGGEYTLSRLLNIMISICNALSYAHSRQVIHRDLKPANVMVGDFGEVYVMDWGLAKVLGKEEILPAAAPPTQTKGKKSRGDTLPGKGPDSKSGDKVTTRGRSKDELTQAGAIMGTPAYMPPEQAQGNLEEVDERSDIYSLGAILYAIMTLTPPVGRDGDMLDIVMRVVEGRIDPPQKRAPERAKAGWIPPELSAISLKALARDRGQRYQTVAALKRDIELYLEGRSVSAKQDTAWEMFKKLVKRNKGASVATAAALIVLAIVAGVFLKINFDARVDAEAAQERAETAFQGLDKAQKEKQEQGKRSVPAFVNAARQAISENRLGDARDLIEVALGFDDQSADARLVKAQLYLADLDFDKARAELAASLKLAPDSADARRLADLSATVRLDQASSLFAVAEELGRHKAFPIAARLEQKAALLVDANNELLKPYRKRIEAAWPGFGGRLSVIDKDRLGLDFRWDNKQIRDLSPLQGMRLSRLILEGCTQVTDLGPLKGMPLTELNLESCTQLRDLSPLKGLPLDSLNLNYCVEITDLTPLKNLPLTKLNLRNCIKLKDLATVRGLKLTWLECGYFRADLSDLTPLKGMPLTHLMLHGICTDLSPLKGMPLAKFGCVVGPLRDLGPLRGMPLLEVSIGYTRVVDLSPLKDSPLQTLNADGSALEDLTPLRGLPLTKLNVSGCPVKDLAPLEGLKLTALHMRGTKVADLTPLKGMMLTHLYMHETKVVDLTPLKGMKLHELYMNETKVAVLTPLKGMKLHEISLTPKNIIAGMDVLREMTGLISIEVKGTRYEPRDFWKRYDAGEFKK